MKTKQYITTAIPYVNSKPHIGNALDYLLADIWSRHQRQLGKEVKFQVGTDEHGEKIAKRAKEFGLKPQPYVDQNYTIFYDFINQMNITYTDFVRTSSKKHIKTVELVWKKLEPYIYQGSYEGWYCQGDEGFVTNKEAAANNGICPDHGTPYQHLAEKNYFLKISEFSEKIKEAIISKKMNIIPQSRANEFLSLLEEGLEDISVSRPLKNASWGIPVPGDKNQIIYVWIDALTNYLTAVDYGKGDNWEDFWPIDVQVVGKDILRFHAGIWPAILLMLGLPLPKTLLVHGHIQVDGAKMSKTVGNVIDPTEAMDKYSVDAFRYYLARHVPTHGDGDFTWEKFEIAYNNELGNDLGNLIQRLISMIEKYQKGVINNIKTARHDETVYFQAMKNLNFDMAIKEVWSRVHSLNKYIDQVKPWQIAKNEKNDPDFEKHLDEVLNYLIGSVLQIAEMLEPFMPDTAQKIKNIFVVGIMNKPDQLLFPKINIYTKPNVN